MENLKQRAVQAAERFLHHRGYDVVDVGWKSPAGDIDIVARDGDDLVFVEVAARDGAAGPRPRRLRVPGRPGRGSSGGRKARRLRPDPKGFHPCQHKRSSPRAPCPGAWRPSRRPSWQPTSSSTSTSSPTWP